MFSLIIAVVVVVLVSLLALATVYYGGSAFGSGATQAESAKIMNQGQTIVAAMQAYSNDHAGALPSGTASQVQSELIQGQYLTQWPSVQWNAQNDYIASGLQDQAACATLNQKLTGSSTIPTCSSLTSTTQPICCSN